MIISGIQKNSFVDYPGKISFVIFTQGCNMHCPYCHNFELIPFNTNSKQYSEEEIFKLLEKRKDFIDAITITGGEPTLQNDLIPFIRKVKEFGFLVKLDTNGSNPDIIQNLIKNSLIDYIAMDIKSSFSKYKSIFKYNGNIENIKRSIQIIKNSKIDYEFRTTFAPIINSDDIDEILDWIKGSKAYYLQVYRKAYADGIENQTDISELKIIAEKISNHFDKFKIKGI